MTLEAGLIALCAIVSIGSMLLVGFALWLRASETGERFSIRKILLARLRVWANADITAAVDSMVEQGAAYDNSLAKKWPFKTDSSLNFA